MKQSHKYLFLLAVVLLMVMGAHAQTDTVADVLLSSADAETPEFTIFLELLQENQQLDMLADTEMAYTVFAPTDEAFTALLNSFGMTLDELKALPNIVDILLYHIVEDTLMAADVLDSDELLTLQGDALTVTVTDDGVLLNETAGLVETDIEASNGVLHSIDAVLMPIVADEVAAGGAGSCFVTTTAARTIQVRVGPGTNRTVVTFLPANVDVPVVGQNTVDDTLWYQVDKDVAAPDRAINEAWVNADDVATSGNCSNVADTDAPPLIPITTSSGGSDSGNTGGGGGSVDRTNTGQRPSNGEYTVFLDQFTNASCIGLRNQVYPSSRFFTDTVWSVTIRNGGSTISFDGVTLTSAGGNFTGQTTVQTTSGNNIALTIWLFPVNSEYFSGQLVYSYTSRGFRCSDTTNFSGTKN